MKFKHLFISAFFAVALAFIACGDESSNDASNTSEPVFSFESPDDLPRCTTKKEGDSVFVELDSSTRVCINKKWEIIKIEEIDSSNTDNDFNYKVYVKLEDSPKCNMENENDTIYIAKESLFYTCQNKKWKKVKIIEESSSSNNDSNSNGEPNYTIYKTLNDLPTCNNNSVGDTVYVIKKDLMYTCENKQWNVIEFEEESSSSEKRKQSDDDDDENESSSSKNKDKSSSSEKEQESSSSSISSSSSSVSSSSVTTSSSSVSSSSSISSSSSSVSSSSITISSSSVSSSSIITSSSSMSSSSITTTSSSVSLSSITSSSSSMPSSSSIIPSVVASSSSQNVVQSSSSNPVNPKSSAAVVDEGIKLELWDPANSGEIQIKTGNAKAGWWYGYDDNKDSNGEGASTLTWKVPVGEGDDMTPVIEACGGICGDFDLVVGVNPYKPYVGFGFNLNATANATGDATVNQSGFCIEYTFVPKGDSEMMIKLGLGSKDASIGYANPFVTLDPAASSTVQNLTWSSFAQPTWAEMTITGAGAAKTLASIKFIIVGSTDGEDGGSGSFSITKFGPLNGCN